MTTVGLAIIARNEAESLPRLLASVEGCFDEVVLLDTGSKDNTLDVFETWGNEEAKRHPGFHAISAEGKWIDDFGAARRAAHELLNTDWQVWADCDDVITGAVNLRGLAQAAPPELAGYIMDYNYAQDPGTGQCVCRLKRERLVRRGRSKWMGRVHEAQLLDGPSTYVPPDVVEWVHQKPPEIAGASGPRNLKILRKWNADEPDQPRVVGYLGAEYLARGKHKTALRYFRQYLKLDATWDEERAQVHRRLAVTLMALSRPREAKKVALAALDVLPGWPDTHLSLAQASYLLGENDKAIEWARQCLAIGYPKDSLLILNPLDYSFEPRYTMSAALAALDKIDDACRIAEEALELLPNHGDLASNYRGWKRKQKTNKLAETWAACVKALVESDEQLKARTLLDTVPNMARRHPAVLEARAWLNGRLRWLDEGSASGEASNVLSVEDGDRFAENVIRGPWVLEELLDQSKDPA